MKGMIPSDLKTKFQFKSAIVVVNFQFGIALSEVHIENLPNRVSPFCPKITQKYQPLHIMRCVDDTSFRANFPLIEILINW